MDRALLYDSMSRWHDYYVSTRSNLIARKGVPAIPETNLSLAISGVRRCGKTSLAIQLSSAFADSQVLYYNFEDPLFLEADSPTNIDTMFSIFEQRHGHLPALVILDEVQNVKGWERWVRSAVDQQRSRFVVTGSNAKLLGADLATSLTGRGIEHTAWPLSLSEIADFLPNKTRSFCLEWLLTWGGLPAVVLTEDSLDREKLLRQYLSDLIHRDIINRHDIRNKRALDVLLMYYQTNLSSLHSYASIKNSFGIPVDTIAAYTNALNEAFLIFEVERFHHNLKVQSRDARKFYVIDAGIRRISSRSIQADIGKLLENLVYIELRRRGETIYYYKGRAEVDFILTHGYVPTAAIQVCAYGMDTEETRTREVNSLLDCLDDLGLREGLIVTMDRNETIEIKGKILRSVSALEWFS